MCGIAGYISTVKTESQKQVLHPMTETIKHRGPDAFGFYDDDFCGLGHRRLKIIDLSDSANQPMIDEKSGSVLVFNGEIYNYLSLRTELNAKGVRFTTESDTEVLLQGLITEGESFIHKLEGDFAFCFRNKKNNVFILARDRFGVKPLYIHEKPENIFFGSEIKALFAAGISCEPDLDFVTEYFRYRYVGKYDTLFKNIKQFPPAHYLKISPLGRELVCYYSVGHNPSSQKSFAQNFHDSVNGRLQADVNVGLFLSGGVDSSAIAAQTATLQKRVSSFTYSFDEKNNKLDESGAAAKLSEKFNFSHQKILEPPDLFLRYPEMISALEEPIGDSIIEANYELFLQAKKKVGVALSGEGADEVFSSYAHHKAVKLIFQLRRYPWLSRVTALVTKFIPLSFFNSISPYPVKLNSSLKNRIVKSLLTKNESEIFQSFASLFDENELKELLNSHYKEDRGIFTESIQKTDFLNWLPKYGLLRTDKLSMAHSLEVRVPFLSHFLVDKALSSHSMSSDCISGDKSGFRAFAHRTLGLPASVTKQKKQPFFDPEHLSHQTKKLEYIETTLTEPRIDKYGILNYSFVKSLISQKNKDFLWQKKIHSIFIFQIWCEVFFPDGR